MRGDVDFQRRHYEFLAAAIREGWADRPERREDVAREFAKRLHYTNPKFDRARFLEACGVVV